MSGHAEPSARRFSWDWWTGGRGLAGVAQPPNPSLSVWAAATLSGWIGVVDGRERFVHGIAVGALVVWSLDELVRGVSPVRRLMGLAVLAVVGWGLFGV